MNIRKYLWILNIIGAIIILISILTPTSYNDTYPTLYYVWMTQIGVDIDPLAIYLLRTDLMLVVISTILALIIFSSSVIAITLNLTYVRLSLNFKRLRWKMLLIAGLVIASTLFWIIMMEAFYNQYGYNHWIAMGGGYSPYFGVIGPFIGAVIIGFGFFVKREERESS
ncbi:MAG: hypothetical protein EAX89_13895 [Candidatus Lokiarchaeota archaeon]|nr:hypothetical protein [Candidatus Lokiarchaeota archaeon]